ncbi:hypothetical protein WDU94_006696 [Cyamophila willieti]
MKRREEALLDVIEKESTKRAAAKIKEQEELDALRKQRDKQLTEAITRQVEEKEKERIETEAEKQAEAEYWTRERDRRQREDERKKWEKQKEKEKYNETLRKQMEFNQSQGKKC